MNKYTKGTALNRASTKNACCWDEIFLNQHHLVEIIVKLTTEGMRTQEYFSGGFMLGCVELWKRSNGREAPVMWFALSF